MSTTVDSKVVEMRFDNQHFEKNVSTTMSTLDNLKQKLQLDGATRGLENVNAASKKVDMTGLGGAIDSVKTRFSSLQVVAITALANITNSAVNAGKRIVESLTIAPIKDGWGEYEMTLNSVQTTMAGTGKTAKEVETELKKLDEYADKTVYSTADMLNNLPKFTNAGVELEKATEAMIGIANATALAGGDAGKASIAFYNLGQAIGTGYLTRMDYNSINNAGIATMEWKEQMVAAAIAAGTLEKAGDGLYKAGNKTLTLQQLFIDGLQEQWATTDVMMKVFGDYGNETTEIGKKAYAAAQDIKTFSMMMDSLKATAGTGWKDTWQIVFGGLEEAKVFWTGLSNFISSIIEKTTDIRNGILESALGKSFKHLSDSIASVSKPLKAAGDTIKDTVKSITDLGEIVDKVIGGTFGNGKERFDLLTKAGQNYYAVQNKVNEKLGNSFRHTDEQIAAQDKLIGTQTKLNDTQSESVETLGELSEAEIQQIADLAELSDAQLKELGYSEKQIEAFRELRNTAKKLGLPLKDLIQNIDEINGRWLLINSFKNIGKMLVDTFQAIKEAWMDIFPKTSIENIANRLFDLIAAFHRLTSGINIVDQDTGKLTETGEKLRRTFSGIFAVVDLLTTILSGAFKITFKVITGILKHFNISVLDITARVGDAFVKVRDVVDKVINTITTFIVDNVGVWIEKFKETEFFKTVSGWFKDAGDKISEVFDKIDGKVKDFNLSGVGKTLKSFADSVSTVSKKVRNSVFVTKVVDGIRTAFGKLKDFFGRFKLPEFNLDNLKNFSQNLVKIGEKIGDKGGSFLGTIGGFFGHLRDNIINWNWQVFKETALEKFVEFWLKIGDGVKKAFDVCKEVVKSIAKFLLGTEEISLPAIMDVITKFLWIVVLIKSIQLLDTIISPLDNVTDALKNFATALKWEAISSAFKSMALALGVLTICIVILTQMDLKKAWSAAGILITLMVVMGGVIAAMGALSSKLGGGLNTAGVAVALLALVGSIALFVYAIKEIDKLELKNPGKTFAILGGILLALTLGVSAISKAGGASFRSVASILTLVAALKLILEVIEAYDEFDWSGKRKAIDKMLQMMLALAVAIRIMAGGVKAGASATGVGFALLALVIGLKVMVNAIEDIASISVDDLKKGLAVIGILMGIMTGMMTVVNLTNKGTILEKGQRSVNNFAGLAIALLAVVGAIWLLGKMDLETLKQGGIAVAQILTLFTGMLSAIGASCSGLKMGSIVVMLLMMGLLMAELAIIITKMKDIPWQQSLGSSGALVGVLLAMAVVLNTVGKANVKTGTLLKWIGAMLALTGILGFLAAILFTIKDIDPASAIGNAVALGGLLVVMAGVLHILSKLDMRKLSTKKLTKLGLVFVGMTAILAALGLVLAMMSALTVNNAISNALAISMLIVVLTGVLAVLSLLKVGKRGFAAIGALALLSTVVLELGFFLHLMEGWNIAGMMPTVKVLATLLLILTGVLAALTLLSLVINPAGVAVSVIAIGLLGAVVMKLGEFLHQMEGWNIGNMMPTVKVLAALLAVLTVVAAACTAMSLVINPAGVAVSVIAIGLLGAVVMKLGEFLHQMEGWNIGNMMPTVKVLAALLAVLTVVAAACTALGLICNPIGVAVSVIAIGLLGAVVLELGYFLSLIKPMGIGNMMPEVVVLSAMLAALTVVAAACTALGLICNPYGVLASVVALGLLGLVVLELGMVLGYIKPLGIGNMMPEVVVLSALLAALTIVAAACTVLGLICNPVGVAASVAALGLLGLVVLELAAFLKIIKPMGISGMLPEVLVLTTLLFSLTQVLAVLTILGFASTAALAGISSLILMITELGSLVLAIGALMSIDGLDKFLDVGIASLEKLAYGIGSIISTFGEGLTSGLPGIGSNLSSFAENLDTFLTTMGAVDDDLGDKVVKLADAIITLTTGNLLSKWTRGELGDYGVEISSFATNAKAFITAMNEMKPETASNMESFANAIKALNDVCGDNNLSGTTLSAFGQGIENFAGNIKSVSEILAELTDDDVVNIQRAANAAEALVDLNHCLPRQGGWLQDIIGSKELATFGRSIDAFADCLISYSNKVSEQPINVDGIKKSAEAGTALAELNTAIPKQGGWAQTIMGKQELTVFGRSIVSFAQCLVDYSAVVTGQPLDHDAIVASANAAGALAELNGNLPSQNGLWQAVAGEKDLGEFGTKLVSFADGLVKYANAAAQLDETKIAAITNSCTAIDELVLVMDHIPDSGGWGDKIFGSKDGQAFGDALYSLATGILTYCETAATLGEDDITVIQNSKTILTELGALMPYVPDDTDSERMAALYRAVDYLNSIGSLLNEMTLSEYDYSGLPTLKSQIIILKDLTSTVDAYDLSEKYFNLANATGDVAKCAKELNKLNDYTYIGIDDFKEALTNLAKLDIDGIIDAFSGKSEAMTGAVTSLTDALTSGFDANSANVAEAMGTVVDAVLGAIRDKTADFISAGQELTVSLLTGISFDTTGPTTSGETLGDAAISGVESKYEDMKSAGKYLVDGFAAGISDKTWYAKAKAKAMANAAETAARLALGINSPSRVFKEIGSGIPEGFAMGIGMLGSTVKGSVIDMADVAMSATSKSISRISDLVSTDIDSQPTIRPVLDLSDVRSGVGVLSGMLGMSSTIGVNANVGAISSMMNQRSQNGVNADVVSAIDKLNKKMDNLGNTSYQINGITYDDGSNVSDAVATLVRAARIERRV